MAFADGFDNSSEMRLLWSACRVAALVLAVGCQSGGGGAGGSTDPCAQPGVVCECVTNSDCGPFSTCEATGSDRRCACIAGYAGDPCTQSEVPKDPGFFETPTPWESAGAAEIDPTAPGGIDAGHASFPPASLCSFGSVRQTVTMPSFESSEPFIARASLRVRNDTATTRSPGFAFAMGDSWTADTVPFGGAEFVTHEYCLGEAAYGGAIEMRLSSDRYFASCPATDAFLEVDRFQIVPASDSQCPAFGSALNGDFEAEGGWVPVTDPGASAGIVEGIGSASSRGGFLSVSSRCETASLRGEFSVPSTESMPSPAIRFWWNAKDGSEVHLWLDGHKPWDRLDGNGAAREAFYCLPPWTAGSVHSITAAMRGQGPCSEPLDWEFAIDDVELVNEPACGTSAGILDPGFESAPIRVLGQRVIDFPGVSAISDSARARTGNGVLELSRSVACFETRHEFFVLPPLPDETGGPALRYWYRLPNNPMTNAIVATDTDVRTLPEGGTWSEDRVCLDPQRVGRPTKVILRLFGGAPPCQEFPATEFAYFDDLELTTDASCPSP